MMQIRVPVIALLLALAACGEPRFDVSGSTEDEIQASFRKSFATVRQTLSPMDQERLRSILLYPGYYGSECSGGDFFQQSYLFRKIQGKTAAEILAWPNDWENYSANNVPSVETQTALLKKKLFRSPRLDHDALAALKSDVDRLSIEIKTLDTAYDAEQALFAEAASHTVISGMRIDKGSGRVSTAILRFTIRNDNPTTVTGISFETFGTFSLAAVAPGQTREYELEFKSVVIPETVAPSFEAYVDLVAGHELHRTISDVQFDGRWLRATRDISEINRLSDSLRVARIKWEEATSNEHCWNNIEHMIALLK
jgi:hypothetical protein